MSNRLYGWRQMMVPTISLFTSATTLICCALPALMVSLGMGAVLAGVVSDFPELIWLSQNKVTVFGIAAALLSASGIMLWHARNLPCPTDRLQALACSRLRVASLAIYGLSVLIFLTGGFFAFIAPLIMQK